MGWSDLPSELIIMIARNITEFTDHLRFRSVCSHWRSSFHSHSLRLPPQLPWLTLPSTSSTHFYSLSEDRVYSNPLPSITDNSNLFGSASGWLFSVRGRNPHTTFSLINPFTGASIGLPSPDLSLSLSYSLADTFIWDCSDSVVVAIFNTLSSMFYCRLGEAAWVSIDSLRYNIASSITFHEGRFYIVQVDTRETVVLDGETLEQINVIHNPPLGYSSLKAHLFVSLGELLFLVRAPWSYILYKVGHTNLNDELMEWIEVNDIGDRALFADNIHCFSVKVGDNCLVKPNCIYSSQLKTDCVLWNSPRTYGISMFDLGNRTWELLDGALSEFCATSSCATVSPSTWVLPSLS